MKKRIIYSIGILIILILRLNTEGVQAAEEYQTERPFTAHGIISKISERIGLQDFVDDIFVSEKNVGQNMYWEVYKKMRGQVEENVSRYIADELGVTVSEVEDFASGDIASAIKYLEKDCNCKVDKSQALALIQNLQALIEKTRGEESIKANLEEQVVATEIYSNGSTEDSGFDLLTDLDIIDKILFQEESITYPTPTVGAERQIDLVDLLESKKEKKEDQNPKTESPNPKDEKQNPETKNQPPEEEKEPNESNARECFLDSSLEDALARYSEENQIDTRSQALAEDGGSSIGQGPITSSDKIHVGDEMTPAPKMKRLTEEICPLSESADGASINFCAEWDLKWKPATIFQRTDNCILCHVDYINELFKKTLSHSLVPNKITGNLFEPAKCKKGFGLTELDLNTFVIWNPVLTPPNDDLLFKPSPFAAWKRLSELYPYKFIDKYIPEDTPETTQEHAADWLLSVARDTTSSTEILKAMEDMTNIEQANLAYNLANLEAINLAEAQNSTTQALKYETETMLKLFESFFTMFEDIVETPCKELGIKPMTK